MPITLICPRLLCRAVLQVPDHVRGKKVRCGECGETFCVPDTGAPAGAPGGKATPNKDLSS